MEEFYANMTRTKQLLEVISKMPYRMFGKKIRLAITRYNHIVLLLSGMAILFFLILDHFLHNGITLSHSEKYLYLILSLCAILLLLAGFWLRTTIGRQWITRLVQIPDDEIREANQNGYVHFFEGLILLIAYAIVFVAYLDAKNAVFQLDAARYFNDTRLYINSATYALTDIRFWAGERSFLLPLLYKISGYTFSNYMDQGAMERVSRIQYFFSILTWTIFAISFSLGMRRHYTKIIAFAIILFLGASLYVTQWDHSMLAESLSTSFMVLLLAFLIIAGLLWDKHHPISRGIEALLLVLIFLAAIFYSFSRDTNVYLLLAFNGLMIIGLFFSSIRTHPLFNLYLIVLAGFLVIFFSLTVNVNMGKRLVKPLFYDFVYRLIPQEESLHYCIAHGMPYDKRYSSLQSLSYKQLDIAVTTEEPVQQLYAWVRDNGMNIFSSYLLSHPFYTLIAPFKDVQNLVNSQNFGFRKILSPTPSRIQLLSTIMYLLWNLSPALFLVLLLVCVDMIWKIRQRESAWFLVLILFLSAYPLALLIWHSDVTDLERHAFQVTIQLRLAAWMLITLLFERGLIFIQEGEKIKKLFNAKPL